VNFFQLMFGEWLELLFGFRGRINRAKYWLTFLIYFVALFALYILFGLFFPSPQIPWASFLTFAIPFILIVISSVALAIKRLHDRNKSGWRILLFYLAPSVFSGIADTSEQPMVAVVLGLASLVISIWGLVELGFLRGTVGPNQYGPDPLQTPSGAGPSIAPASAGP
jgi:uncharacterized membrane protein YhaH (DUF805 family)